MVEASVSFNIFNLRDGDIVIYKMGALWKGHKGVTHHVIIARPLEGIIYIEENS